MADNNKWLMPDGLILDSEDFELDAG